MPRIPICSSSESREYIMPIHLEGHLNDLPDRVQEVFRRKIRELGEAVHTYVFAIKTEIEYFPEEGRKQTKITHVMSKPIEDGFRIDTESRLYTEVELPPVFEAIGQAAMEDQVNPENKKSFCSTISELIGKIYEWFRNFFARFCCPARA